LLELTGAAGAAIVYEGRIHDVGQVPKHEFVRRVVQLLADPQRERIFATDHLESVLPETANQQHVAAGILAADISRDLGEYVIWFRPATDRTVDWAGDPRKQADPGGSDPDRLTPRGSFALWRELVRGRSLPWQPWQVNAASELRKLLLGRIRMRAAELQQLNDQLSSADRAKDEFIATVSHELRTPLNAIVGWIHVLRSAALDEQQRQDAFDTVTRNAKAQAKLIEDLLDVGRMLSGTLQLSVEPIRLDQVIEQSVASMKLAADAKNIRIRCVVDSQSTVMGDAQRLHQVMANLVSNAV
jgi:light-regulated signal transduction histidine kinase (bacteriophytochrome)